MEFQYINPVHKLRIFHNKATDRIQGAKHWQSRGYKITGPCGPYIFRFDADHKVRSFYLDSAFMIGLRWQWCDDVRDTGINHRGWFIDDYQDETIRGLVMALPHGRGFLAGWSMGEGMISEIDLYVYDNQVSAAYAADSMAEHCAELDRERDQDEDDQDAA